MVATAKNLKGRIERFSAIKSLSNANKKAVLNFLNSKGYTAVTTRDTYLTRLKRLSGYFKKRDFKILKNHDVNKYMMFLDENFGKRTYNCDVVVIKGFLKWIGNSDAAKDVRKKRNIPQKHQACDLLTQDEIKCMLDACRTIRDRCFLHILWETAARIGELQTVKLKDVQETEHGFLIQIRHSKTELRPCHILEAKDDLYMWLQQHPNKDNPNSYLFKAIRVDRNAPLCYSTISGVLGTIAKDAKIKKPITPHIFRKSRATYLSVVKGWSNPTIEKACGWAEGSPMVSTYIRLSNDDVLKRKLLDCGLAEKEKEDTIWKCLYCGHVNSAMQSRCFQCKKSPTTARDILEKNVDLGSEMEAMKKKFELFKEEQKETIANFLKIANNLSPNSQPISMEVIRNTAKGMVRE